jgi:hypothetical protein
LHKTKGSKLLLYKYFTQANCVQKQHNDKITNRTNRTAFLQYPKVAIEKTSFNVRQLQTGRIFSTQVHRVHLRNGKLQGHLMCHPEEDTFLKRSRTLSPFLSKGHTGRAGGRRVVALNTIGGTA